MAKQTGKHRSLSMLVVGPLLGSVHLCAYNRKRRDWVKENQKQEKQL